MALNLRQQRFVDLYVVNLNGRQSAVDAGFSSAKHGYRLLRIPEVREAILVKQKAIADKLGLSAEWVLLKLVDLHEKATREIPVLDREGKPTGEYKVDGVTAWRALETIGKHLGMFTTKIEVDDKRLDTTPLRGYTVEKAKALLAAMEADEGSEVDEVAAAADAAGPIDET